MSADLELVGKPIGTIPVHFSYNIIDLFSGHLYSSPIKAIEELVANSFDAFASQCIVYVPEQLENQCVWVWDNGDSINIEGLRNLWLVADTNKRTPTEEKKAERRGRLPIGKFGIGKLASYVLGRRITHICKKNGEYLAVTMDYKQIKTKHGDQKIKLSVRKLSQQELVDSIPFVLNSLKENYKIDAMSSEQGHWTLVVIDNLKQQLDFSRLNWILATALPLRPDFKLFLNGREIVSSKSRIPKIREWQIGKDNPAAAKLEYETCRDDGKPEPFNYYTNIPEYGSISGLVEIYSDDIDAGKSQNIGFSNGFFVMVRERLINENDNLFGITDLPHLGFNKIRAIVYANFLDNYITANREDTSDSGAKKALQNYLKALYNIARGLIEKKIDKEKTDQPIEDHLKNIPSTLLSYPLKYAVEKISMEPNSGYSIIYQPGEKITPNIEEIELQETDIESPIVTLNEGKLYINANHPFYRNYADYPGVRKLMIAEILLEAYMIDAGVAQDQIREILSRRDNLLRTLSSSFPENALNVSETIRNTITLSAELEIACVDGFRVLGFEATHLGKKGKPDGLAVAPLGVQKGGARGYIVIMDAKSTQNKEVKSGNIGFSTISRHKDEYNADYAVVIAPEYQVTEGENSKTVKEARRGNVCLICANDFANLILGSAIKPLSLEKLKDLFELRSPEETKRWICDFNKEPFSGPPVFDVLNTVWKIQQEDTRDAPEFAAIKYKEPKLNKYSKEDIKELLKSVARLVPELVVIIGEKIQLNQSPENIIKHCTAILQKLPSGQTTKTILDSVTNKG